MTSRNQSQTMRVQAAVTLIGMDERVHRPVPLHLQGRTVQTDRGCGRH